mgnify:CR=1 FL=1
MKILIVHSGNLKSISPFVSDQVEAIVKLGVKVDYFLIKGKGFLGYLKNLSILKKTIKQLNPDLIHAHGGLSGLLSVLQKSVPVVTTFHGSDINKPLTRIISFLTYLLSRKSIFVSKQLSNKIRVKKPKIIPCGVDISLFNEIDKIEARKKLGLSLTNKYILFSSTFDKRVKNYPLAKKSVDLLKEEKIEIIELKNYSRKEVSLLMNAADLVLLTSFTEGSPQLIKEAMACNRPIVTTNVGDVEWLLEGVHGAYVCSYDSSVIAKSIQKALNVKNVNARSKLITLKLDSKSIAQRINHIYNLSLK